MHADALDFLLFSPSLMDDAIRVPRSELASNPDGVMKYLMKRCGKRDDMSRVEYWRWEECTRFLLIVLTEKARFEDRYCDEFGATKTKAGSPVQWAAERMSFIENKKLKRDPVLYFS